MGVQLNVSSVISDFELNIIKAVDDMLGVSVEGCFFHFSKALQTKVEKSHFKTRYENDLSFQHFIKECGALAHCPLEDIEEGLRMIKEITTLKMKKENILNIASLNIFESTG